MKRRISGRRCLTLVEVLVSILIITSFIIGIYRVLNMGNLAYYTEMGILDLHHNSHQAMYFMLKKLRESSPADIDIVAVDSNNDRITFHTPNERGIQFYRDLTDINNDNILNQIIREYPAGSYSILANDIKSLQFNLDSQLLEVQLIANKNALGRSLSLIAKGRARLRNE